MKMPIDKKWFERRAAAEGDHEIGAGGNRKTMTLNLTQEEIGQLERMIDPERITLSEDEAKALLYGQPQHEFTAAITRLAAWLAEYGDEDSASPSPNNLVAVAKIVRAAGDDKPGLVAEYLGGPRLPYGTLLYTQPATNHVAGRWLPIDRADKTITNVEDFSEVGVTIRTSDRYWCRDDDGRVYEAAWSEGENGCEYWWAFEAESPVDPVEFMPHPLDMRFNATPEVKP